jgi:nucleoside-triphosphatase THEP1
MLLVGERQVGKSVMCQELTRLLRENEIAVSGLLTQCTGPHALEVTEIHTSASYPLTLPFDDTAGVALTHFRMDIQAMARSAAALDGAFPTQVFILDELGPLELELKQGWSRALQLLQRKRYALALIVVRPELLVEAIWQLPASVYTVIRVTPQNRDTLPVTLCRLAHEWCTAPHERDAKEVEH